MKIVKSFSTKIKNRFVQLNFNKQCLKTAVHFKKTIKDTVKQNDLSVHFLSGKSQLPMTLVAALSFQYHSSLCSTHLHFHDDGTMRSGDFKLLHSFFPDANLISRQFADTQLHKKKLDKALLRVRGTNPPLFLKLIDVFELSKAQDIIFIDSDVLFFSQPKELLDVSDRTKWYFNRDIDSAYLVTSTEALDYFDVKLKPKLNTGLWRAPKEAYSRDFLIDLISHERFEEFRARRRHVAEQTSAALLACSTGTSEYLPKPYDIDFHKAPENSISKHYIGAIRHDFVSEGIPHLQSQLKHN